jgi:membrane associated rhomboid family serine protease
MFVLQIVNGSPAMSGFFGGGGGSLSDFDFRWVFYGPAIADGEWWRVVTSGFVHFGAMHILFNMLILYRLGQQMEPGIGHTRFALLYTASLLAGSLAVALLDPGTPSLGASGAVFGMAGAATVGLWQRGVRFYQTGWGPLLVINLFITFTLPDISVGAHLGGLVAGTAVGAVMLHPQRGTTYRYLGHALAIAVSLLSFALTLVVINQGWTISF